MDMYHAIGTVGMAMVVYAYFLLQSDRVKNDSLKFQYLNLIGAILLIISLFFHFNLGSFLIEVFWIMITVYGLLKHQWKKKRQKKL
ncbi:CBU_0592 family membrane protein [Sulfurospirillum barnesii]|uniref:CBU-0592-like domain-containing protein n=1 Tax=Sulfurospirillum barnesii (strain ATCC 700032 / DSM 10660 / SES-3) TaxID=760154 RepID=I3XVV9_SULBS|nr:hypothetical protein [Sulfurospirillum barnesii]AFL68083.1 hypothetical protein Sulba_0779 [Sulfurospirillum barnesii SES-3]